MTHVFNLLSTFSLFNVEFKLGTEGFDSDTVFDLIKGVTKTADLLNPQSDRVSCGSTQYSSEDSANRLKPWGFDQFILNHTQLSSP